MLFLQEWISYHCYKLPLQVLLLSKWMPSYLCCMEANMSSHLGRVRSKHHPKQLSISNHANSFVEAQLMYRALGLPSTWARISTNMFFIRCFWPTLTHAVKSKFWTMSGCWKTSLARWVLPMPAIPTSDTFLGPDCKSRSFSTISSTWPDHT